MSDDTVTRTLKLDVWPADDACYRRVQSSVRQYRAALRHCYGILLSARAAGADVTWKEDECSLKPNTTAGMLIGALATGQATATLVEPTERKRGDGNQYMLKIPRGASYEVRAELVRQMPTMSSFVLDSARRDLHVAWTSGDPEHPKASRGYLALQGARGIAQFNRRGISFPMATAKPVFQDHGVVLKWDKEIGQVEFKIGRLDAERWRTFCAIRSGEYDAGTVTLSEQDGKMFLLLSYSRPPRRAELDSSRVCRVKFQGEGQTVLVISGPDGDSTFDSIGSEGVMGWLQQLLAARKELEARRAAHGSPSKPWGHRRGWLKAQQVLNGYTLRRERGVADYNHRWSARVLARAIGWRCGVVMLAPLPETLGTHPWNWSGLMSRLEYKLAEAGCSLVIEEA